jgi:acyl CoA:acetate/3-ketoacid CoA transferase
MAKKAKVSLQDLDPEDFVTEEDEALNQAILEATAPAKADAGMIILEVSREIEERNKKLLCASVIVARWKQIERSDDEYQQLAYQVEQLTKQMDEKPAGYGVTALEVQRHEKLYNRRNDLRLAMAEIKNKTAEAVAQYMGFDDFEAILEYSRFVVKGGTK